VSHHANETADDSHERVSHNTGNRPDSGSFRYWLLSIVLLAAVLRLWSIDFGVPMVTHPDEVPIVYYAEKMVDEGHLNPHWFRYPALLIYLQALVIQTVNIADTVLGLSTDAVTSAYYVGGRLIVAAFGIGTVALVGLLGRRMVPGHNGLAGIIAAAMVAVSFVHVKDSHYLKPDVPLAFFVALSLWFTLDALQHGKWRSWLFAAAAVGLAAAFKYNGALAALIPAAGLLGIAYPPRTWFTESSKRIAGVAGAMALVAIGMFLLVNPYIVVTPDEFLSPTDGIVAELDHYSEGHDGAESDGSSWLWYLQELGKNGFGLTLIPLVLLGTVTAAAKSLRGNPWMLLLLLFPLLYFLMIGRYPVRFDRQLIPLLPSLALIGAVWIPPLLSRIRLTQPGTQAASIIVLLALMSWPAAQAVELNVELGKTDTRYPALTWTKQNLPEETTIAHEHYTPPLEDATVESIQIWSAYEQPIDWFEENSIDYLMISSHIYQRYLDEPDRYPEAAAFYSALISKPAEVRFESSSEHAGPDIYVFRIDRIEPALTLASEDREN
jgi:4-amino-4-deoxy-L-arabinose transferase-like glycosyltransferase